MSEDTISWPRANDAVNEFYTAHMATPLALFEDLQVKRAGSGRPSGQRRLLWSSTFVLAISALEAGLEELVFSAHGQRLKAALPATRNLRKALVERPLMTPGPRKIEQLLLTQFGVVPSALPQIAEFEARAKNWAKGGSGKGSRCPGPTSWSELTTYLHSIVHVRNGTAHGDVVKLRNPPDNCEGLLWLSKEQAGWSIQQPHALTALRAIVSVFNTVAHELDQVVGLFPGQRPLKRPDDLVDYLS